MNALAELMRMLNCLVGERMLHRKNCDHSPNFQNLYKNLWNRELRTTPGIGLKRELDILINIRGKGLQTDKGDGWVTCLLSKVHHLKFGLSNWHSVRLCEAKRQKYLNMGQRPIA